MPDLALSLLALACAAAPPAGAPPVTEPPADPTPCCATWEDVDRLDGQLVVVEGVYAPEHVMKRRPGTSDAELEARHGRPRTVALRLDGGLSLMLGVYYEEAGLRPEDEVERLAGRRVRVTGTLHRATPERMAGDVVMQTMVGPYIEVRSVAPAPGREVPGAEPAE